MFNPASQSFQYRKENVLGGGKKKKKKKTGRMKSKRLVKEWLYHTRSPFYLW